MTLKPEPGAHYSPGTILALGTFGNKTPAGRRFHNRCLAALAVLVVGTLAVALLPRELRLLGWPVAGLCMSYINWELWRYLQNIDELERRLQLEAMAFTYVVGLSAAVTLGSVAIFFGWSINPGALIALEPIRAWRLLVLTKRYQ